jgi:glycosyltransferase involved in cell wall biosynthesis
VHDLYPYDLPESFSRLNGFCKRLFIHQCFDACDGVTCVSDSTRQALERRFPRLSSHVPVRLVHNFADFSATGDSAPPRADRRPYLLAVAQHQPNKRLDLLLEAYARLRGEGRVNPDLQLLIVGSEGADSERLRRDAERWKLDSSLHWLPQLSDVELGWMYRNCSAFVTCSSIEGFCLPLLEALVFNCRVVASDIPVFHEIAGEAPVYFDLRHRPVENLMDAIVRVLDAPQCTVRDCSRFSRSQTAAECLDLYALLLPEMAVEDRIEPQATLRRVQQASE